MQQIGGIFEASTTAVVGGTTFLEPVTQQQVTDALSAAVAVCVDQL